MVKLRIKGMTCEHCALTVKKALESLKGVKEAKVYFPQGYAEVYTQGEITTDTLIQAVRQAGYDAELLEEAPEVYVPKEGVYDLLVLGGGSAGFAAAIRASELGAKVLVVEDRVIGGTCLNRGCVPSKYLIDLANTLYTPKKNPLLKESIEVKGVNIKRVVEFKEELLKELRKEKYWDVLEAYPGIEYKDCRGKFLRDGKAQVGKGEVEFHKAVITTGSSPGIPPIKNLYKVRYYTSDDIFNIDHLPEHLLVIGGGAVGLELGQAFLRLGSKVTLIEVLPDIAFGEEPELRSRLRKLLEREGMNILTGVEIQEAHESDGKVAVKVLKDGKELLIEGSDLLVATGRTPNTKDIGLESVGVKTNSRGFIEVDEYMQTSNPKIYAAGDCIDKLMLVTVAAVEGSIAAQNALLGNKKKMDYGSVPHAIFTEPELASVGLKEKEAKERGYRVDTRILEFSKVPRAILGFKSEGLIKMVIDSQEERVLGVHILSSHAVEIIHKAVFLIKYGLKLEDIIESVDVYPTLSESIKLCAQSFRKDVSKLSCCAG